jgi:hypothetical protein
MVEVAPSNGVKARADPMIFMTNLHVMYSRTNLLKMNSEKLLEGSSFEISFLQKKENLKRSLKKDNTKTSEQIDIDDMIEKLKALFSFAQKGGGMTLDTLKEKIRERISQINPRYD